MFPISNDSDEYILCKTLTISGQRMMQIFLISNDSGKKNIATISQLVEVDGLALDQGEPQVAKHGQ